jgi:hypothetical protein
LAAVRCGCPGFTRAPRTLCRRLSRRCRRHPRHRGPADARPRVRAMRGARRCRRS